MMALSRVIGQIFQTRVATLALVELDQDAAAVRLVVQEGQ